MAGPWEKYGATETADSEGPWSKYGKKPSEPEAKRETTTAEGLARGMVPYVGGAGVGALVGGGLGFLAGGPPGALAGASLGARAVPIALAIQDYGTGLYNVMAERFGGRQVKPLSAGMQDVAESVGIGRPGAPIAEAIGAGASGAGVTAAALRGAQALNPVVQGALNTMAAQPVAQTLAGGAAGAASGTLQAGGETNPLLLMLAGMGGAAVTPAAVAGIRAANTAVTNRLPAMLDPLAAYRAQVAGERGPQIVSALREAPVSETGVPLSTAQASVPAEAPGYTAMMQAAAEKYATDPLFQMMRAQEQSRANALARGAGTPEERAALVSARSEAAAPLYEAARAPGVVADIAPAQQLVRTLMRENPGNRALMRELRAVNRNMFDVGPDGKPRLDAEGKPVLRTDARQIGSIIDDLKTAISKEDNKFIKGELTQVRDALVESVPNLPQARAVFREMSTPINQREGMLFLKEKLEAPIAEGMERAGAFATAVKALTSERDAPAALRRAVSDMPRYKTLEELYPPNTPEGLANLQRIDAVRLDLARDAKLQRLVRAARGSVDDVGKIGTQMLGEKTLVNPLDPTIAIANRIITNMRGKLNKKLAMELAFESLNPKVAADALERSLARQAQFERFRLPEPRPLSLGTTAAAALPTALNALSQTENQNAMAR